MLTPLRNLFVVLLLKQAFNFYGEAIHEYFRATLMIIFTTNSLLITAIDTEAIPIAF